MVKLYVGGLDTKVGSKNYITDADLRELFSEFKSLKRAERVEGKSFGFIHMDNRTEAERAVEKLNRKMYKDQKISVECSRSKPCKFYVGKLPQNTSSTELRELFEEIGAEVLECDVVKNFGFVHVETNSQKNIADDVIAKLNGKRVKGTSIIVQFSETVKRSEYGAGGGGHDQFGAGGQGPSRGTPMFKNRPSPYPTHNGAYMNQRGPGGGGGMHVGMDMHGPGPMPGDDMMMTPMFGGGMMDRMPGMGGGMMDRMPGMGGGMMDRMPGMGGGMDRMPGMGGGIMDRMPGMDGPRDRMPGMDRRPMDEMRENVNRGPRETDKMQRGFDAIDRLPAGMGKFGRDLDKSWLDRKMKDEQNSPKKMERPSMISRKDGEVKKSANLDDSIKDFQGAVNGANLLNLGQNLTGLVKSGRYVDTHIQCNGPTFKAHAVILCAKSTVFSELLENTDTLNVNYSAKVVNLLLQFMYSGQFQLNEVSFDFLPSLVSMADEFQISGTKDALAVALAKNLSAANSVQTLQFAAEFEMPELKGFATQYIVRNAGQIMKNAESKSKLKMFPDVMFELVEALSIQNAGV